MATTCRAGDASVPVEIRDALISYVRKNPTLVRASGELRDDHLDDDWFCLLGVTGGTPCDAPECKYHDERAPDPGTKKPEHVPRWPLGPALPLDGTTTATKEQRAPRRRAPRKAPRGRRRSPGR
ncbi:MAG TPA: hypothetical protein VD838_18945 [Anaeromyxobacteraceae bacterium]|nr:hypothetical protein [Anaeromyxobacteraceae bacterium]